MIQKLMIVYEFLLFYMIFIEGSWIGSGVFEQFCMGIEDCYVNL